MLTTGSGVMIFMSYFVINDGGVVLLKLVPLLGEDISMMYVVPFTAGDASLNIFSSSRTIMSPFGKEATTLLASSLVLVICFEIDRPVRFPFITVLSLVPIIVFHLERLH